MLVFLECGVCEWYVFWVYDIVDVNGAFDIPGVLVGITIPTKALVCVVFLVFVIVSMHGILVWWWWSFLV